MQRCIPKCVTAGFRGLNRAASSVIDRILDIGTAHKVDLAGLRLDAPDRVSYEAGGWLDLRRILRPGDVSSDSVFLDLGSGKGRIVLMAARYQFRRIIGVELSERLNAIARRNVAACRLRLRCPDIELITADVLDYRIPDEVSVAYMFNPFRGPIFYTVLENLNPSVDRVS